MRIDPTKGTLETDFEITGEADFSDISEVIARLKKTVDYVEPPPSATLWSEHLLNFQRVTKARKKEVVSSTDSSFVMRIERYGSEDPLYQLGSDFCYKEKETGKYLMGEIEEIWEHPEHIDYTVGQIHYVCTPHEYVKIF